MRSAQQSLPIALRAGSLRFDVTPGATFRIGRHPSNDLVLDTPSVSRFHAQLAWVDGRPVLQDLLSTNGTFADGMRLVGSSTIEVGGLLKIGDVVVHVEPGEDPDAPALLDDDEEDAVLTLFSEPDTEREGTFSRNGSLQRVLLDLEWEERTGTLEVRTGTQTATVTFALGRVITAAFGGKVGLDALERVLAATMGAYRFSARFAPSDGSLDLSVRDHLRRGYWDVTRRLRAPR
jgi:pSer/pThr/pTyr-binding forkhead associated (FHA) protein